MNFIRLVIILFLLFSYTSFKFIQLLPYQLGFALGFVLVLFCLMIGSLWVGRVRPGDFETGWFRVLVWVGTLAIGFWASFMLIAIPIDILDFGFSVFNSGIGFMTTALWQYFFGIILIMTMVGYFTVVRGPKVVRVDVSAPSIPDSLHDFKIAQISDLHIGPTVQSGYVQRVVSKTNELESDIIVITGDLVDSHTESIKRHLQPLAELRSKYGVYYVSGNHEYYWGIDTLYQELEKLGITILQNSNQIINVKDSKLLLAGIPDPAGSQMGEYHRPNLNKARASIQESDYNILLSHRPDPYHKAEDLGFQLQMSGHTHAGQFFPFSLFIPFAHKYYRGLNRHGKMWIYVNPGTGYWGPANRFGISAEITLARLKK